MVADAVSWAYANGAKVINNSWCNSVLNFNEHEAFRNAYLLRIVVTAAMGNTQGKCGQDQATDQVVPAAWADILMAVGATNEQGDRITKAAGYAWESGIGPHISVVAPGVNHFTDILGGGTGNFAGTSEATPFVSGLAGLLWSEAEAKSDTFTAWDIRQLMNLTARPPHNKAPGWNDETGWGLIDATAALRALQPPNALSFVTLGPTSANCYSQVGPTNWSFLHSWTVVQATRCEVRRAVTFPQRYTTTPIVWGRPASGGGVTPSNPNSEIYWTGVVPGTATATGVTLRTYVYWIYDQGGYWWPAGPSQVSLAYGVLGQVAPFAVTADVPGLITVKGTYPLTGSASDPASDWLWQRSYDGGPWQWWANAQNSQFVAYAGTYTLDWRLSARRISDGVRDTGYATSRACIPYNPSTCQPARPMPSPQIAVTSLGAAMSAVQAGPSRSGRAHFGSGLWIGIGTATSGTAVRFYSFRGPSVVTPSVREQPNLLEVDSVSFSTSSNADLPIVGVTAMRVPVNEAGMHLFRVQGRLDRSSDPGMLSVGLAADPDLGDASKNRLGFQPDLGLVWVRGEDSTYFGYVAVGSQSLVRVQQFGAGLAAEPASDTEAYRLMIDSSRFDPQRLGDVRFLLVMPGISREHDGTFFAAFAVLQAGSLDSLQSQAGQVKSRYATFAAVNDRLSTPASTFALRQARSRPALRAELAGSAGVTDARSQLQQYGITALDYAVPDGQEVTVRIRIYNSSGGLVRTLVQERLAGGSYHVEWDRLNERGERVSPGVYVAVMEAGAFRAQRKLVVVR